MASINQAAGGCSCVSDVVPCPSGGCDLKRQDYDLTIAAGSTPAGAFTLVYSDTPYTASGLSIAACHWKGTGSVAYGSRSRTWEVYMGRCGAIQVRERIGASSWTSFCSFLEVATTCDPYHSERRNYATSGSSIIYRCTGSAGTAIDRSPYRVFIDE